MTITRRQALAGAALLPSLMGAGAAGAQTPLRADAPTHWRFDLIGASLTVLLTSIGSGGNPRRTFGLNVDDEAFAEAARGPSSRSIICRMSFSPSSSTPGRPGS